MNYKRKIIATSLGVPECHYKECDTDAAYEGWARIIDPFIGTPTGRNIFIPVCAGHKMALIGFQEEKEPDNGTKSS